MDADGLAASCLPKRQAPSYSRDFFDLFATRTSRAGGKSEVRQCAPDGRRLGVLETGDGIYVAVAFLFGCPSGGGRQTLGGGAVDERLEGDLAAFTSDELGIDSTFGKARIEQLDALGDGRVLVGTEKRVGLRHRSALLLLDWLKAMPEERPKQGRGFGRSARDGHDTGLSQPVRAKHGATALLNQRLLTMAIRMSRLTYIDARRPIGVAGCDTGTSFGCSLCSVLILRESHIPSKARRAIHRCSCEPHIHERVAD